MSPFKEIIFSFWYSFFRSYRAFLPSSFSTILSSALIYFICSPVSVLVRFFAQYTFLENETIIINTFIYLCLIIYILIFFLIGKKNLIKTSFRTSFLKDRFTQSGLSFPWKPRTFGDNVLWTLFIVTHASIVTSGILHFFTKMRILLFSRAFRYHLKRYFKRSQFVASVWKL